MNLQIFTAIRKQLDFKPSHKKLAVHILWDVSLIILIALLYMVENFVAYAVCQILSAVLFFRAFGIMHEAVHGNLSRNAKINAIAGIVYGALCFLPFLNWKKIHLKHHYWTGNVQNDPTMRLLLDFPKMSGAGKSVLNFGWQNWIPILAFLQHIVFWKASLSMVGSGEHKPKHALSIIPPAMFVIVLLAMTKFGNFYLGFFPAIYVYLLGVEVINFPHHLEMNYHFNDAKLPVWHQHEVSRTCVYPEFLSKHIVLNFNYHAEHHLFPTLPWHQLPRAQELISQAAFSGYQFSQNHEWILKSRKKELALVLNVKSETELKKAG